MTIDKSFIEKIIELSPVKIREIDNVNYSDKKLFRVDPPTVGTLTVHTMTAIVDFCCGEDLFGDYLLHVASPERVLLLSEVKENYLTRQCPLQAELQSEPFPFGRFLKTMDFIIALQSRFVQDATTAAILALVGNLTTNAESRTLNDGVTQTVEAKVGLSKRENAVVPNPVRLAPYRTFLEIEQPGSNFVFRINAIDHTCALFEADGGAWKNRATADIKEWLKERLCDLPIGKFKVLA
jgi:hypothetical protein